VAKLNMVKALNLALLQEMERDPDVLVIGEDVGVDGGVFRVTEDLHRKFGGTRVVDSPLAEAGIIGAAVGMSLYGLKPVCEIQFSGFAFQCFHQIENHVARYRMRSQGRFGCQMVVRMPYGGGVRALEHHSESEEQFYAHVPGLKMVIPSGPRNARALLAAAIRDPDPVIFFEAKALYHAAKEDVPDEIETMPIGRAHVDRPGRDLTLVAQMDNAAHQYLTSDNESAGAAAPPFSRAYTAAGFAWPKGDSPIFSPEQIERHIQDNQPDALAVAAQKADKALNNQSLVVLFTFAGKTMLFSGDAQWGNWANFLFGGAIGTPGHTALTAKSRAILANLDFYKVGHHGSTNATPMDVVTAMKKGCAAMCSTDPGAYGHEDKGTEVPRGPLMAALEKKTQNRLARSDQVAVSDKSGKTVPPTASLPALAAPFAAGPQGSIDYWL